jgi:hypothetical protein
MGDTLHSLHDNLCEREAIPQAIDYYMHGRVHFHSNQLVTAASVMKKMTEAGFSRDSVAYLFLEMVRERRILGNVFTNFLLARDVDYMTSEIQRKGSEGVDTSTLSNSLTLLLNEPKNASQIGKPHLLDDNTQQQKRLEENLPIGKPSNRDTSPEPQSDGLSDELPWDQGEGNQ